VFCNINISKENIIIHSLITAWFYVANYFLLQYRENLFVLRNPATNEYHCSLLRGVLREADSVTYGLNCESVLNKLDDFNVCDGQLPQDMMHILEPSLIQWRLCCRILYVRNIFSLWKILTNDYKVLNLVGLNPRISHHRSLPTSYMVMVISVNQVCIPFKNIMKLGNDAVCNINTLMCSVTYGLLIIPLYHQLIWSKLSYCWTVKLDS